MLTLFVSYSGLWGGGERLLLDCAAGLDGERVLACPEGRLAERAREARLRVIPLPERSLELRGSARDRVAAPLRLAAHGREARRLIGELHPDLAVAWGMRSAIALGLGPPLRPRPAVLVFQHNDLLPGSAVGRVVRAAARRFDRVVALSRAVGAQLDAGGALGDRLRVSHPGVDLELFPELPPPPEPGGALVLGAIVDWKRPGLALEAVALASERVAGLHLRLAGEPLDRHGRELLERLRERAARPDLAGRVELTGRMDAHEALSACSCLLHCADSEPFGLVVVEAMASGRPVVAPHGGGPAELLDDAVGRLYPPGDAAAAAAALEEVLGEPGRAERMGAEARRRAVARHGLADAQRRWREAVGAPAAHG